MSKVLRQFYIVLPYMLVYHFLMDFAAGAFTQVWAGFANGEIDFEFTLTFSVGGYVWQYLIIGAGYAIIVIIVNIFIGATF